MDSPTTAMNVTARNRVTTILEQFPYRYVQVGTLEINGKPDCRIQKIDSYTGRYRDMYLCDNEMQFMTAIEDFNYTKWLDPDRIPCYTERYDNETDE